MSDKHLVMNLRTVPWERHTRDVSRDVTEETGDPTLDKMIEISGYSYDPRQDVFYSNIDPWQRKLGYCRLYDEASAVTGMIIDCEPIFFEYGDKQWMIGLWKGQYDMVTGGEIGVYTRVSHADLPSSGHWAFYTSADDEDFLQMSFTLFKNGRPLFSRSDRHWWLTGFKLGEFSQPSELSMAISITCKNEEMREAFVKGLVDCGYVRNDLWSFGPTVKFTFSDPKSPQPITRVIERPVQWKNKLLCEKFDEITGNDKTVRDKVRTLESSSPGLYKRITKMGRAKPLYTIYRSSILAVVAAIILLISKIGGHLLWAKPYLDLELEPEE